MPKRKPKPVLIPIGSCEQHQLPTILTPNATKRRRTLKAAVAQYALTFAIFRHRLGRWTFTDGLAVATCKGCGKSFFVATAVIGDKGYASFGGLQGWTECTKRSSARNHRRTDEARAKGR